MWLFLLSTLVVLVVNSSCSCSCSSTSTSAILFQTDSFEPHLSEQSGNHLKERKLLHDIGFLVELVISCCSRDLSATREGPAVIPNRWTVWNWNSWKFFASESSVLCLGGFQPRTGVFFSPNWNYLRGSISSWKKHDMRNSMICLGWCFEQKPTPVPQQQQRSLSSLIRTFRWPQSNTTSKWTLFVPDVFLATSKQQQLKWKGEYVMNYI